MKSKISLARKCFQKINRHFSVSQSHLKDIVEGFLQLINTLQTDIEIQYDRMLQARKMHTVIVTLLSIQLLFSILIIYKLWS